MVTMGLVLTSVANAATPHLIGYWKLDETSGRIASDSSGNGNDGRLVGGVDWAPTSGKCNGAAKFGGGNCHIEIPATEMTLTTGTVALWVRLAEPQSTRSRRGHRFLFGYGTKPDRNRIQLYMDYDDTQLDIGLGDQHLRNRDIMTFNTNVWYHIALTWDGSSYAVMVDGNKKAAGTYAGLNYLQPSVAYIGDNGKDIAGQGFHGLIDEVVIFNRVLNKDEVTQLYNLDATLFIPEPTLLMLVGNC